jgi:hypothetical protein
MNILYDIIIGTAISNWWKFYMKSYVSMWQSQLKNLCYIIREARDLFVPLLHIRFTHACMCVCMNVRALACGVAVHKSFLRLWANP